MPVDDGRGGPRWAGARRTSADDRGRFGIDASHIASAAAGLENDPTIGADPERLQRAGLLTLRAVLTGR